MSSKRQKFVSKAVGIFICNLPLSNLNLIGIHLLKYWPSKSPNNAEQTLTRGRSAFYGLFMQNQDGYVESSLLGCPLSISSASHLAQSYSSLLGFFISSITSLVWGFFLPCILSNLYRITLCFSFIAIATGPSFSSCLPSKTANICSSANNKIHVQHERTINIYSDWNCSSQNPIKQFSQLIHPLLCLLQCDQIWRNLATLAKSQRFLTLFVEFILYLAYF